MSKNITDKNGKQAGIQEDTFLTFISTVWGEIAKIQWEEESNTITDKCHQSYYFTLISRDACDNVSAAATGLQNCDWTQWGKLNN